MSNKRIHYSNNIIKARQEIIDITIKQMDLIKQISNDKLKEEITRNELLIMQHIHCIDEWSKIINLLEE